MPVSIGASLVVYVSCADTREIWHFAMDSDGALEPLGASEVPGRVDPSAPSMPLAVSPDRRFLYAALRTAPFPAASFAIAMPSGALTWLGTANLPDSMAYIATDRSGRHLLSASYGGAKLASNPIDPQGRIQSPATQVLATAPNAHSILTAPSNRFAYAAVLGGDHVMHLGFDAASGRLTPLDTAASQAGAGPRHLAFHPKAPMLYCINELDGTVDSYAIDATTGALRRQQSLDAMPQPLTEGSADAADIQVTPDGRFLYASERRSSTIAGFRIDPGTGTLSPIGSFPTEASPRSLAIDPASRFLLAAGQLSARLAVYAIDPASGRLAARASYATAGNPNWIEIIPRVG